MRKSPPPFTKEHKEKIRIASAKSQFKKGHRQSEEVRKKMSMARKGKPSARKGKKASEDTRRKQREYKLELYKDKTKHPRWKGGKSRDKHANKECREWRSKVFERDNWTCQTCGVRGVYLEGHHIKSWAKFPELRYELSNGVTLCLECHKLTDNYKGKNK